jgi:hypothetical protein
MLLLLLLLQHQIWDCTFTLDLSVAAGMPYTLKVWCNCIVVSPWQSSAMKFL